MISHDDVADILGLLGRWAPEEQAIFCIAVGIGLTHMRGDPPPAAAAEACINRVSGALTQLVAHGYSVDVAPIATH